MPSRERSLRTEAIILRQKDWGEADRLIFLYSREHGKLRAIVKGARRLKSRKAGHLQPLSQVTLLLAYGRDLWIVTQVETINPFLPIKADLVKTGYASYVIELLDRFTPEEGSNYQLYKLLVETFGRINQEDDPFLSVRYYEIRLLDLLGFRPELFSCVSCEAEIQPEDQYFSFLIGGVVCPRCGAHTQPVKPISTEALRYLRHFQRSNYNAALKAHPSPQVKEEMEQLMQAYFSYTLERHINTVDFLRDVKKPPANGG